MAFDISDVIKIIGIIVIVLGIAYLVKPGIMKWLLEFFKKGSSIYIAGLLRFVLGVVFLLAARECSKPTIIGVLGVLFLLGGFLIFILGPKRTRPILEWWQRKPEWVMRALALLTAAFGVLIIYAA